jgi:hypothetical protein
LKKPGWNRILSSFNKRFFVLDLDTLKFYYTTKSGSHLSNAKLINLEQVKDVRYGKNIDEYPKDMPFSFEVDTNQRTFRLFAGSAIIRDLWLESFSAVIKSYDGQRLYGK